MPDKILRFLKWKPTRAYREKWLRLPKSGVNIQLVQNALVFGEGEHVLQGWVETDQHILIPRMFYTGDEIRTMGLEFKDLCLPLDRLPKADFSSSILLRQTEKTDQVAIVESTVEALRKQPGASINVGCGKGKTPVALEVVARLGLKTLIIVPSVALLSQWSDEITTFLGIQKKKIGVIHQSKFKWKFDIAVASIDTVYRRYLYWGAEFFRHWGLVIFDEEHFLGGTQRSVVSYLFPGKRLGLTATFDRPDGRQPSYRSHVGPICATSLEQEVVPNTLFQQTTVRPPTVAELRALGLGEGLEDKDDQTRVLPPSAFSSTGEMHYMMLCGWLDSQQVRREMILRQAREDLREGRKIIALSKRLELVLEMAELMKDEGAVAIYQKTKGEARVGSIRASRIAFCTEKVASFALNDPKLDTLYIIHPTRSIITIPQSFGRIQRVAENRKPALVRVFEDVQVWPVLNVCKSMRKFLISINYPYQMVPFNKKR